MANNLYTKSYIKKRLRDVGIISNPVIDSYDKTDARYWSIKIEGTNDILICYRDVEDRSNVYFKLIRETDTKQIITQSVNVIIDVIKNK